MFTLEDLLRHLRAPAPADEAQRLFHGRGHAYPGLHHVAVDWLPPVALVSLYEPEPAAVMAQLATALRETIPACRSVQLQHKYIRSGRCELLNGEPVGSLIVSEDQLKYQLSLGTARNTGLFLDMRNGRRWVRENSTGCRVLNLFAYTCGFSVAAHAGGANSILNVDMSRSALTVGRENHRLNGQDLGRVAFEKLDIFKSFGRLKKRGPYDLLICDPPTFQKGSVDIARDYPRIMKRLTRLMAPGATVMLCLNAPELSREFLRENMAEIAPAYREQTEVPAPAVFVEAQGKGLKILLFQNTSDEAGGDEGSSD